MQMRSGTVFRPLFATRKSHIHKVPSFAELNLLAIEYPYWEPLDAEDIARINSDLRSFHRWKPNLRVLEDTIPNYLKKCRNADQDFGLWFEFALDTIVRHSPFTGTRSEVVDLECMCQVIRPMYMLHGQSKTGKSITHYLCGQNGGISFVMSDNRFYRRNRDDGDSLLPHWFANWRPDSIPPPLPNWSKSAIRLYEEAKPNK